MSAKKWCITFFLSVLFLIFGYTLLNYFVDPFGVFGDKIFHWYSYNMTNNPRVAKIAYLDQNQNYKKYDSYMIGCSSTSSFSVEDLNHYFGGSFYNMIMYGADMLDVEQTCEYVIQEYGAKRIMVNIFLSNATKYDVEEDNLTRNMHEKLNGESKISFYGRYLFLNPQYAMAKIKAAGQDTYLTQPFDVFCEETGTYDKKVRDVEPIHTLEEYYESYPFFANYPKESLEMTEIDTTIASVKRIKEMCEENGVEITFVMAPAYSEYVKYFRLEQLEEFYAKLAEVTDYWDFTTSSLTSEPRFFYDETHFRNSMGKMAIAKMVEANDTYYPEDIGEYVTKENVEEHLQKLFQMLEEKKDNVEEENETSYTKKVPILTYHSIVENPTSNSEISLETFQMQMKTLKEEGYTTVTFEDLIAYVEQGKELPKKPICITFDDGYLNNYEKAFPVLKEQEMKATIFVIGVSVGSLTNYKETNYPITPHFTYAQAKEMIESGLLSIQSHTYDMHQWAPYEMGIEDGNQDSSRDNQVEKKKNSIRENILQLEEESETEYREAMQKDIEKMNQEMQKHLGEEKKPVALSYPSGKWDTLTNVVLKENGIKATVTIEEGTNEIIKGLPQSLYALKRYNMDESVTKEKLQEILEEK